MAPAVITCLVAQVSYPSLRRACCLLSRDQERSVQYTSFPPSKHSGQHSFSLRLRHAFCSRLLLGCCMFPLPFSDSIVLLNGISGSAFWWNSVLPFRFVSLSCHSSCGKSSARDCGLATCLRGCACNRCIVSFIVLFLDFL